MIVLICHGESTHTPCWNTQKINPRNCCLFSCKRCPTRSVLCQVKASLHCCHGLARGLGYCCRQGLKSPKFWQRVNFSRAIKHVHRLWYIYKDWGEFPYPRKKQTPAWEYTCGHLDHKNVPGQSCPVSKTHINALDFFRSQTEFLF